MIHGNRKEFILPMGGDIRTVVFIILAVCGMIVCVITAFNNLLVGFGITAFLESLIGALISLALLLYTIKTGDCRLSMILTIFIIFIGLFTFLFFSGGGYHSGMPSFFIFAVVFTAFMLDGYIMPILVFTELAWYTIICVYAYFHPPAVDASFDEAAFLTDVLVDEIIVSVSLAVTMYVQIRIYRRKQWELNKAILAAEEANRAKSDFLAKMSHDIRTPLNTMMAMNEMIVANTSSAKIREWVNDSNVSGRILLSLIDDMLDLTRIEAGRMELLKEPWDTRKLFGEAEKIWKPQAGKAGLDLKYRISPEVPEKLIGDEDAILKITNNLLSNAVKYTKTGEICLEINWDGELIIIVSDTGAGIAPDFLDKMFKPFERGTGDIYRETSGSGLGLAIVRELTDAMGGNIDCESIVDEGTEFTVRIPQKIYRGKEEKNIPDADTPSIVQASGQFVAPEARILVVDDNPLNRKVIKGFLEPTLIQIDDVESGYEALEMIDIKEYDLVLMDLRMPGIDGAETLDRIKKEYPDFDAPIVVLTADIMNGIEEQMLSRGFSGFLSKPVSSAKLIETISGYIPEKLVPFDPKGDEGLTLAEIENYQELLMSYGINLSMGLEYNAGNPGELLTRAALFEEYADETIEGLDTSEPDGNYYIQIHSLKSIARGIGAYLLAEFAESVEYRKDDDYSRALNPILLDEYRRVREGYRELRKNAG